MERILVVEDEQIVALDIRLHLQRFGYEVVGTFAEAEEAISFLETTETTLPDLVLMDIHLQGAMDGISAAEEIRRRFRLPVIFLTAYADEETLGRAKVTEPFAYIIKPFEERELRTAVVLALYRHQMRRQMEQREQLLSLVMEAIETAIVVTDHQWSILFSNSEATALFSMGDERLSLEHYVPASVLTEAAESGPGSEGVPWTQLKDNSELALTVLGHTLHGEADYIVWVIRDTTPQVRRERSMREKEEQLAHSRRMDAVGRLSAGLAHDFNNLVTVILGYARLALDDVWQYPNEDTLKKNILGMYETARRSAELTRRLLAFSRVPVVRPEEIVLHELVTATRSMIEGLVTENVNLDFVLDGADAVVYIDRNRLQQILLNLVLNSRDAMPSGGSIRVTTEVQELRSPVTMRNRTLSRGSYAVLSITDSGEGIAPEHLPQIFEPFFTTKDETQGSGFGLATVYSAVDESDGGIDVSSTLGHGTRFSVFLPISAGSEVHSPVDAATTAGADGDETILVIQEQESVRTLVSETLRHYGYTPLTARSVGEGLLMLRRFPRVAAVISDLSAPYFSVTEIVELFRESPGESAPRIMLILSGAERHAGQDETLLKPFEPLELVTRLRQMLDSGVA